MTFGNLSLSLTVFALILSLVGCGEKTVTVSGTNKLEQSRICIDCHQSNISPGTAKSIVEEWKLSRHNTSNAAGCADCHEPESGHPTSCNRCHSGTPSGVPTASNHVSNNPDRDGKCDKCHARTNGLFPTPGKRQAHFNNSTSVKYPASYVSSKYVNNCNACHNPHDTTTGMSKAREWAKSGHGDLSAGARTGNDFKTYGSYRPASDELSDSISPSAAFPDVANKSICIKCHTSTGYINYVTSGFSDLKPFAGKPEHIVQYNAVAPAMFAAFNAAVEPGRTNLANQMTKLSPDFSREATNCNVCHDDGGGRAYGYKLRNVNIGGGAIVYYNYSGSPGSKISKSIRNNKVTYPDAGASNMCVICHTGRENGEIIKLADARNIDFTSVSRIGAHDFVAGSDLYRKSGFHFYSSSHQYQNDFAHDIIGLDKKRVLFGGAATFDGLKADSRGYGPCIGCHVNSDVSHTFKPVNEDAGKDPSGVWITPSITTIVSRSCANCHTGTHAWTPEALQAKKEGSYFALQALNGIINYAGLTNSTNWISAASIKAWLKPASPLATFGSQNMLRLAAYNMGAVFNYRTLGADPGGFAHNSVYIRRLIYDSIDWIDNGQLDQSVNATFTHNAKDANGVIINATPPPNVTTVSYSFSYRPGAVGTTTYTTLQDYLNSLTTDAKGWQKAYDWLLGETSGKRP